MIRFFKWFCWSSYLVLPWLHRFEVFPHISTEAELDRLGGFFLRRGLILLGLEYLLGWRRKNEL